MTDPMTATPARAGLDELDALLAAATPGEWRVDAKGWIDAGEYDTVLGDRAGVANVSTGRTAGARGNLAGSDSGRNGR